VLFSDGYLKFRDLLEDEKAKRGKRFFRICMQLPMHFQVLIAKKLLCTTDEYFLSEEVDNALHRLIAEFVEHS